MADENPLSGFAQGTAQGAQMASTAFNDAGNWAVQNAQLALHKQQLEQQQQQLDDSRQQAQVKMGETMFSHLDDYAKQTNPVLQKLKGKQIEKFAQTAGLQFDPGWLEGLKNDQLKQDFFAAGKAVLDPTNPKAWTDKAFSALVSELGSADSMKYLAQVGGQRAQYLEQMAKLKAAQEKPVPGAARIESTQTMRAQGDFNSQMKDSKTRLEGASRIQGIFEQAAKGKLKTNEAFKSLIDSEIVRLETGASNPAFGLQQQRDMHTTAESLGELKQKITGKPQDTVPKPVLTQLKSLGDELTKNYMQQANTSYDTLSAGATPVQKKVIDEKFGAMKNAYQKRFGYWHEPDGTVSKPGAPGALPPTESAPQPPTYSPQDLQQAMKIKMAWANEKDPARKALIAQKAQEKIPQAILQKIGGIGNGN